MIKASRRSVFRRIARFFTHKIEDDALVFAGGECSSVLVPAVGRIVEEQYAVMQAEKAHVMVEAAMLTLEGFGGAREVEGAENSTLEPGYLLRTLANQHSPASLMKAFAFVRHQLELGMRTYSLEKKRRGALESLAPDARVLADLADAVLSQMENKTLYADHMAVAGARAGELLHRMSTGPARRLQPDQLNKLAHDILHALVQVMKLDSQEQIQLAEQRYEHSARWLVGLVKKENISAGPMLMAIDAGKAGALAEKSYAVLPGESRYKH